MTQHNINQRYLAIGVDIQNDFCPGGSLAVPNGNEVVEPFNKVAKIVRDIGGLVVFTRDWHPAKTSHFDNWPPHCIANTTGAEFHPDLVVTPRDIIISKGTKVNEVAYSGFEGTTTSGKNLEDIIKTELQKTQKVVLLIGGLATDYCVKSTVLDALNLKNKLGGDKLGVIAMPQAMRSVNINPNDGKNAQLAMKQAGASFVSPRSLQTVGSLLVTPEGRIL